MKIFLVILLIAVISFSVIGCQFETITYCPYCSTSDITEIEKDVYQCNNSACGKKFGATLLPSPR